MIIYVLFNYKLTSILINVVKATINRLCQSIFWSYFDSFDLLSLDFIQIKTINMASTLPCKAGQYCSLD